MSALPEKDKVCFNCTLHDCIERNKGCKRKSYSKDKREYKAEQNKQKMTTVLKRTEPIVVR